MQSLEEAVNAVNRDEYVLQEDGRMVTQSTSTEAILSGLRFLDIHPGHRVMEIGTGSGYSTALIAHLVGSSGKVVSIDIDPDLTQRATNLFQNNRLDQITAITKDGREGIAEEAPFDRIIAWTTPDHFPQAWAKQVGENGYIVAPFRVLSLADSMVMVRFKKEEGVLKGGEVREGAYIPMTSEPVKVFFGHEVFAELVGEGEEPFWASSHWMKDISSEEWKEKFLSTEPQQSPFQENGSKIRAYLLGKQPQGLTTAFHPDNGFWIGYSTPNGFALASNHENQWIVFDESHANILRDWWDDWLRMGRPTYQQLEAYLVGNQVRIKIKND